MYVFVIAENFVNIEFSGASSGINITDSVSYGCTTFDADENDSDTDINICLLFDIDDGQVSCLITFLLFCLRLDPSQFP